MSQIIDCLDCGETHIESEPCIECTRCSSFFFLDEMHSTYDGLMCKGCEVAWLEECDDRAEQEARDAAYDAYVDRKIHEWKDGDLD